MGDRYPHSHGSITPVMYLGELENAWNQCRNPGGRVRGAILRTQPIGGSTVPAQDQVRRCGQGGVV